MKPKISRKLQTISKPQIFQENHSMDTLKKKKFKNMILGDVIEDYGDYGEEDDLSF